MGKAEQETPKRGNQVADPVALHVMGPEILVELGLGVDLRTGEAVPGPVLVTVIGMVIS